MISIEQIRILETKVHTAVERIQTLNAENSTLRAKLSEYETRVVDLQKRVETFQSDQAAIEAGILSALSQLDQLEDRIGSDADREARQAVQGAAPPEDIGTAPSPPEEVVPRVRGAHGDGQSATDAEDEDGVGEDPELDIF